jgi:hypothetical protein
MMAGLKLQPVRFGDFLVERNVIDEGQLLDALADHWISGCRIGEAVVRRGYVSRDELAARLSEFETLSTVYV